MEVGEHFCLGGSSDGWLVDRNSFRHNFFIFKRFISTLFENIIHFLNTILIKYW